MINEFHAKQMRKGIDQAKFIKNLPVIESRIDEIEKKSKYFKIGKTGQSPEERFENYKADYDEILSLFASSVKDVIDNAESKLIEKYISHPKCRNEKTGDSKKVIQ